MGSIGWKDSQGFELQLPTHSVVCRAIINTRLVTFYFTFYCVVRLSGLGSTGQVQADKRIWITQHTESIWISTGRDRFTVMTFDFCSFTRVTLGVRSKPKKVSCQYGNRSIQCELTFFSFLFSNLHIHLCNLRRENGGQNGSGLLVPYLLVKGQATTDKQNADFRWNARCRQLVCGPV